MASQELVLSQEEPLPTVPAGKNSRGRAQTRKTKLVEHTTQEEETPAGDTVEIHQVRQVQEVVKKVAVVRPGRRARGSQPAEEPQGEEGGDEDGEAGPSRRVTRRLDAELNEAMERQLEPMAAKPGQAHRTWKKVVVEGGTAPESAGGEEGQDAQEQAGTRERRGGRRQASQGGSQGGSQLVASPGGRGGRAGTRFRAEAVAPDIPEDEALEPQLSDRVMRAALEDIEAEGQREAEAEAEEIAGHGSEEEEEEEQQFGTAAEDLNATPEDLLAPAPGGPRAAPEQEQADEEEEEAPAPAKGRKRSGAGAAPKSPATPQTKRKRKAPGADTTAAEPAGPEQPSGSRGGRRGRSAAKEAEVPAEPVPAPAEEEEQPEEEDVEEEEEEQEEQAAGEQPGGVRGVVGSLIHRVLGGGRSQEGQTGEAEEQPARGRPAARKAPAKKAPAAKAQAKGGKAAKAAGGATKKGRGRGRRGAPEESYKRYVHRVLTQVHPELRISARAMEVMQSFMVDAFEHIANEASRLTTINNRKTLSASEIQTAVKLALPGELGRHAVSEGRKAVARFSGLQA